MASRHAVIFDDALDIIESLPAYQQRDLVDIIRHRLIEHRRDEIAANIRKTKKEYAQGHVKRGSVEDLMKDLDE